MTVLQLCQSMSPPGRRGHSTHMRTHTHKLIGKTRMHTHMLTSMLGFNQQWLDGAGRLNTCRLDSRQLHDLALLELQRLLQEEAWPEGVESCRVLDRARMNASKRDEALRATDTHANSNACHANSAMHPSGARRDGTTTGEGDRLDQPDHPDQHG